jgi:hypothetical protein
MKYWAENITGKPINCYQFIEVTGNRDKILVLSTFTDIA